MSRIIYRIIIGIVISIGCTSSSLLASSLSSLEQSILTAVDDEMPRAEKLLGKVVNINSGTMNFPGVKAVGDVFLEEFKSLGFKARWVDGSSFNRAGHLIAVQDAVTDATGLKLLIIGHLDTVFSSDSKFQTYKRIKNNKVMGPGITDMKGGDVVIIQALRALKKAGVLHEFNIQVVMTGDEESRGQPRSLSNKTLLDAAKWADIAIGFEDGDGNPETAVVARRGSIGWQLDVKGKAAHSSQIFQESVGYGAILEAARILNSFREALEPMHNLTFNPGVIVGGTDIDLNRQSSRGSAFGKSNVIAQSVKISGGLRASSEEQLLEAKRKMQKILSENLLLTQATLHFSGGYPAMAPRKSNYQLLALYNQISEELGYGSVRAVDPRKAGAADISITANYVTMSLDGLGLMGKGGHTINETADMKTFPIQIKRAALLMYRLFNSKELPANN